MFYRRKLIFAVLQVFGGKLEKIRLQKLLFLICKGQTQPVYEFVPFKYGCYSYSAKADLTTMVNRGQLSEDEATYMKIDKKNYLTLLSEADRMLVNQAYIKLKEMSSNALMKHTYTHYPYYAINSVKADQLLNAAQIEKIHEARPLVNNTILFTIGYEGISLEAYLNKLIKNDIKTLVDVRNNPISQKFGFSKSLLQCYCNDLKIEYVHLPEVGIQSEYRQALHSQSDYDHLFAAYQKRTLSTTQATQIKILNLLQKKQRIALTCFEADICQCHRKSLAEAIQNLPGFEYVIKHI